MKPLIHLDLKQGPAGRNLYSTAETQRNQRPVGLTSFIMTKTSTKCPNLPEIPIINTSLLLFLFSYSFIAGFQVILRINCNSITTC
jgi:hypothetical protein